jgi:hypothetical protein
VVTPKTNVSITNTISAMLNDCTTLELLDAIGDCFPAFPAVPSAADPRSTSSPDAALIHATPIVAVRQGER